MRAALPSPHRADHLPGQGTHQVIRLALAALLLVAGQQAMRTPDIHFASTRQAVADAMLRLAKVGPDDVVYDLGSGDGRIVILAAQKYGARGVGVEIDPGLVA